MALWQRFTRSGGRARGRPRGSSRTWADRSPESSPPRLCAGALVAGCGGARAAPPSYCQNRSDLESSVKGLTSVDLKNGGANALKTQLEKVQSDAKALVSSAKSDFPSQTDALSSSVSSLETSAKQLSSSPSTAQIAAVATGAASVATALKDFTDAAASKC